MSESDILIQDYEYGVVIGLGNEAKTTTDTKNKTIMSSSDNMFNGLVGRAFTEAINTTQKDNNPAAVRLFLALVGILFFVGAEAVKVFFRKDFRGKAKRACFKI